MPSIDKLDIGQRVSFQVYPENVVGNNFYDVVYEGTFSASIARSMGIDIQALHAHVYHSLPAGTPDNPEAYPYIQVRHPDNNVTIIGQPWVRQETIVVRQSQGFRLQFDGLSSQDMNNILLALNSNGYTPTHTETT